MKAVVRTFLLVTFVMCLNGCAVYMAANQPDRKNVDLFKAGTKRSLLLAEYGHPTISEQRDGKRFEVYRFVQGYSGGAKAGRAVFHGAADVMTLGLWEVIGTPIESVADGNEIAYEVTYDEHDQVDQVVLLSQKSGK